MVRATAAKAVLAAEALDTFLRSRFTDPSATAAAELQRPGVAAPLRASHGLDTPGQQGDPGGSQSAASAGPSATSRPAQTDWLRHRLTINGPAQGLAAFRSAASGAGTVPWQLDLDRLEEDWFLLLAHPDRRQLSLAGARTLAGQLRDAVERRHALAVSHVGRSRACPFDLHVLVPVPPDVLRLGPDHPDALAWLWQHWGTTQPLRRVGWRATGRTGASKPKPEERGLDLSFWSADWTPWRAFERIRDAWPRLRFAVEPDYGAG